MEGKKQTMGWVERFGDVNYIFRTLSFSPKSISKPHNPKPTHFNLFNLPNPFTFTTKATL
jgi:hypothetical protein